MTKSVIALLLMISIVTAAHVTSAHGGDKSGMNWDSGKSAILFLPQHFENVPWLGTRPGPKVQSDFPIGSRLENIGVLRLQLPGTQFSTNTMSEPHLTSPPARSGG